MTICKYDNRIFLFFQSFKQTINSNYFYSMARAASYVANNYKIWITEIICPKE